MSDMDEIVKEFLMESYENLDQLDRDFVTLETDPTSKDKLSSIFRTIHTIKGTCGCLGFGKLEGVAHVGENLLCRLRDGQIIIDSEITTGLLKLVDAIREILATLEKTGAEGDKDYVEIKQVLIKLNERPSIGAAGSAKVAAAAVVAAPVIEVAAPVATAVAEEMCTLPAEMLIEAAAETVQEMTAAIANVAETGNAAAGKKVEAKEGGEKESLAGNAIRVDVNLLDKLMNLVGELVLTRNQVLQHTSGTQDVAMLRTAQRLNLITTELQGGVMKTRMQPIGNLWNKFPRIVRDVSNSCGKKVRIEMEGRETELDKTIIEAIKDPLTHVIRNSVDHGVETPAKRLAAGKSEEGCLSMRAFHEGGQVNIEIKDDGKGIDPEAVKKKAVEKGLITQEQSSRMGEREAINLVFAPGFSTAEKITNVSGRGVGMDVVKTNIERIGGTVDIKSKVGEGTTLRIKIPLTLAIIPALVVTSAGERFAIPQVSLLELVHIDDDTEIEMINGTPIYRLRGNILPLVHLNSALAIEDWLPASKRLIGGEANIVVLRGGERQFGLVVDQINDTEEIVVKPLGKQLQAMSVFAGATIMGDGKVALILDVMGLAQQSNVISHGVDGAVRASSEQNKNEKNNRQTLLLCNLMGGQRTAIPLSQVARLEEFSADVIEDAGGQAVVQYRGEIMPLIDVTKVVGGGRRSDVSAEDQVEMAKTAHVVVFMHEKQNIGLRVERIVDVVDEEIVVQRTAMRRGVLGTAIIKEKVTELLDLNAVVRMGLATELAMEAA